MNAAYPANHDVGTVYMSVDMEGVAGVAVPEHVGGGSSDFRLARSRMTAEVNAAIAGAADAGASRFIVNDAHGQMSNLIPEELDRRAELIIGFAKPLAMAEGLGPEAGACFFIGYHAMAGALGMFDHTYGSRRVFEMRLDGEPIGETGLNTLLAGYFGVPVTLIAGDDAACDEATKLLPNVVVVKTKVAVGRYSGRMRHPSVIQDDMKRGAALAWRAAAEMPPMRSTGSHTIDILFFTSAMADTVSLIPGTTRSGARSVAFTSDDFLVLYRALLAMIRLAPSAVPEGA